MFLLQNSMDIKALRVKVQYSKVLKIFKVILLICDVSTLIFVELQVNNWQIFDIQNVLAFSIDTHTKLIIIIHGLYFLVSNFKLLPRLLKVSIDFRSSRSNPTVLL